VRKLWGLALDVLLSLAILAASVALRGRSANAFVTWDEPAWTYRSTRFLMALSRGEFGGTLLTGHPGVLTMWSGALGLLWHRTVTGQVSVAQLAAIDAVPVLDVHDAELLRELAALLPMAKSGLLAVHALLSVALYWLLRDLLRRSYALAGVAMLLLDPYYLALGRVLHIDALSASLMLLSLVAALTYARRGRRGYLVASGVGTAMAALAKSYGVVVAPIVMLVLFGYCASKGIANPDGEPAPHLGQRLLRLLADGGLWVIAAAFVGVILWPALWVRPLEAVQTVVGLSLEYASAPGDATASFFRGHVQSDLPFAFYPVNLFFRTTPLAIVGAALALLGLLWRAPIVDGEGAPRRRTTLWVLLYAGLFLAVISLSEKKFDRYTLPILVALDLVAALGIVGLLELVGRLFRRAGGGAVAQAIACLGATAAPVVQGYLLLLPLWPAHYLAYYNPWAGGAKAAVETIPVGWGEGIEQAAAYLASQPDAEHITVATWAVAGLAPSFPGEIITLAEETIPLADHVLLYIGDVQNSSPLSEVFYGAQEPELVVRLNGIKYAWVYPNIYYVQLSREIAESAQPGDLIVLNTRSAFERNYLGNLPWYVIRAETEAEVAAQLRAATTPSSAGPRRIYYLEYQNGRVLQSLIRRQLAQNAYFLWRKPFAYGTMSCYLLADDAHFRHVKPDVSADVDYGHELLLEGYGLASPLVQYRQELGVALQWRALRQMQRDYHVFLHLVDEEGRMWGQRDLPIQDAEEQRTSDWEAGSSHLLNCSVPLEAGVPPGQYWLAVGVYSLADLSRLDIIGAGERKQGTEFHIGPVSVVTPTVPPAIEDLAIQVPTNLRLDGKVELLGYSLSTDRPRSGEEVGITLFWRCLAPLEIEYDLGLRLERDGGTVAFKRMAPAGPHHPTQRWVPQEVFRFPQSLAIPADASSGLYQIYLNLYQSRGDARLVPEDVLLATVSVEHRERLFEVPPITHPAKVLIGDHIEFLGYDLEATTARPGDTLRFTLYWRALSPMETSYTVFTHLLDASEIVRGQRDSVPAGGERPTTSWAAGEVIVDAYEMTVNPDTPPGPHLIEIGMYDPTTFERPPMALADGTPIHERRVFFEQIITVTE